MFCAAGAAGWLARWFVFVVFCTRAFLDSGLDSALDSEVVESKKLDSALAHSTLLDSTSAESAFVDSAFLDSSGLDSAIWDLSFLDSAILDSADFARLGLNAWRNSCLFSNALP